MKIACVYVAPGAPVVPHLYMKTGYLSVFNYIDRMEVALNSTRKDYPYWSFEWYRPLSGVIPYPEEKEDLR